MKKQTVLTVTILSLIVILGGIGISACTSIASAQQKSGVDSYVGTAAAATLVQYMIETEVAAHAISQVSAPVVQEQPTQTPYPTYTPVPTPTALPTQAPTVQAAQPTQAPAPTAAPASRPKIVADQNTNCRAGPSTRYTIQTVFMKGTESSVEGRDQGKNWWYIVNPSNSSGFCWVWDGSTTVVGDTSTLAVVPAPANAYPAASNLFYGYNTYSPYSWCGYDVYSYYPCAGFSSNNCYNFCGKKNNNCGVCNCKPNKKNCNPVGWWGCNPYYGNCNPWGYPIFDGCKKSSCPAVTIVNYKNYCKNYPQCCDDEVNFN